jgi:hypothetical protein
MKNWIKVISILMVLGAIAAFLVFHFMYNKPHPDYEKMDAAYTTAAADLYKSFTLNKTEAGSKYNGKVVAVTGRITKVEAKDSLTTCVFVFENGMFGDQGVRCTMLSKYGLEARKIQPGSDVRLKGYCTGFNDTDVILDKCSMINP